MFFGIPRSAENEETITSCPAFCFRKIAAAASVWASAPMKLVCAVSRLASKRPVPSGFDQGNSITLDLNRSDFTTAKRIVDKINETLGAGVASAVDAGSIRVTAPVDPSQRVDYISILENMEVDPGQAVAKVIVNSRTGTIVIGQNVKVSPAAVTQGSLTVTISEDPQVSQPNPLSGGQTVVTPQSTVKAKQEAKPMFKFGPGTTLDEIVRAVNQVGAAPSDLVAILEALKQAGALQADLIVI